LPFSSPRASCSNPFALEHSACWDSESELSSVGANNRVSWVFLGLPGPSEPFCSLWGSRT
jgi:hypothetical protein